MKDINSEASALPLSGKVGPKLTVALAVPGMKMLQVSALLKICPLLKVIVALEEISSPVFKVES